MREMLSTTHPDLAAQLVDPALADRISRGSTKKVEWSCRLGHTWTAPPNSRTAMGSGCPVCAGKVVLPGFNDLASQRPDIAAQLLDPALGTTLTPNSGKKVAWRCPEGHTWTAPVNTRSRGHGCSVCTSKKVVAGTNDLATTHPEVAAQLADPEQGRTITAFSAKTLTWTCDTGHTWEAPVARITNGATCPFCSGLRAFAGQTDMATTHPELAAQLDDPSLATVLKAQSNKKVTWHCAKGHHWEASPNARVNGGTNCPVCANRVVVTGFNDLGTTHPELAAESVDPTDQISWGSHRLLTWLCPKGHTWDESPNNRVNKGLGCRICSEYLFVSKAELEIAQIVRNLVPDTMVRTNVRNLIGPLELDVVVDDANLAIEFNGVYFHSETSKAADYHLGKSRRAGQKGLHLLHIWSDDWATRRDVVIRALAHRLGATDKLLGVLDPHTTDPLVADRTMARKLEIRIIDGRVASSFLEANHLQGKVAAALHLGLVEPGTDTLRALLSLRSPRHAARTHRPAGVWEVQRYATLGVVAGGFTKLLTAAEHILHQRGEHLTSWVSFTDDGLSDGGLYQRAGFTVDHRYGPNYRYAGNRTGWVRTPKERFQKKRFIIDDDLLYEDGWTEHQAALANGLYRVYDAGKTRWVKHI